MRLIQRWWARKQQQWLNRRIPPAQRYRLNRSNIFIFPSRFGWLFVLLCVALFVLGTNYQNNLVLIMCYFLLSLMLLCLFRSYQNFRALQLTFGSIKDVYAGNACAISLWCHHPNAKGTLLLNFNGQGPFFTIALPQQEQQHWLDYPMPTRGVYPLPRIRVQCFYPLGLFRCWSYLAPPKPVWVYPAPLASRFPEASVSNKNELHAKRTAAGNEDFDRLRESVPQDARTNIAWKIAAQGRGLHTKLFEAPAGDAVALRLPPCTPARLEQELSKLSYLVSQAGREERPFTLQLGRQHFGPDKGKQFARDCLRALAGYRHDL